MGGCDFTGVLCIVNLAGPVIGRCGIDLEFLLLCTAIEPFVSRSGIIAVKCVILAVLFLVPTVQVVAFELPP